MPQSDKDVVLDQTVGGVTSQVGAVAVTTAPIIVGVVHKGVPHLAAIDGVGGNVRTVGDRALDLSHPDPGRVLEQNGVAVAGVEPLEMEVLDPSPLDKALWSDERVHVRVVGEVERCREGQLVAVLADRPARPRPPSRRPRTGPTPGRYT